VMFILLPLSLDGMDEQKGRKRSQSDAKSCVQEEWGHTCHPQIVRGTIFTGFQRCMENHFSERICPFKMQIFRTNYVDHSRIPNGVCGDLLKKYIPAWYANVKAGKYGNQKIGGPELFRNEKNELYFE